MAFFFFNSSLGRMAAFYPSPAGATESLLPLATWEEILEAAGSSLDRIVKTTVFLSTLDDFQAMNEVYRRHVGETPPARATVAAGLPSGILVEIEAIALA